MGCYGIAVMANEICKEQYVPEGGMEIGCNNVKALQREIDLDYFISPIHTHFDLSTATQYHVKFNPIKWKARHVQGYQDENPFKSLDRCAKLNGPPSKRVLTCNPTRTRRKKTANPRRRVVHMARKANGKLIAM